MGAFTRDAKLLPDLRDPMSWSIADRCFVLAWLFILVSVPFIVGITLGARDGEMALAVDLASAYAMRTAAFGVDGAWLVLSAAALAIRRRAPESRALEHATIQLFSVSLAVAGHLLGMATTPFALAPLGALVVGLLLFRRGPVLLGAASCTLLTAASFLGSRLGLVPYGPVFRRIPAADGHIALVFHVEMMLVVLTTVGIVLGIFLYVLGRLREREARLESLSRTDPLTGLANRREFFAALERELGRVERHGGSVAVVLLDLDHFKTINDSHGHQTGDAVLVAAARVVAENLRCEDLLARYGGEEFVALLPDADIEGARAVAERCRARLEAIAVVSGTAAITATASFGIAAARGAGTRAADVLRAADEALYRAKRAGRNRVEIAA